MNKLTIRQWAEEDRPREKLLSKGVSALSDAELLAILIGSGSPGESAVDLCKKILLRANNNLLNLGRFSMADLCDFKGIGEAKAITVQAAMELGRRYRKSEVQEKTTITSSADVFNFFYPQMGSLNHEEFWILLLSPANKIMNQVKVSQGGVAATSVDVKLILKPALLASATSVIACHNHPSGNTTPSPQDNKLTQKIAEAARYMDIKLLDHIILCEQSYYSYADEGKL
ncbi:MAG: RadC family protein [Bacteroidales bacterium]